MCIRDSLSADPAVAEQNGQPSAHRGLDGPAQPRRTPGFTWCAAGTAAGGRAPSLLPTGVGGAGDGSLVLTWLRFHSGNGVFDTER